MTPDRGCQAQLWGGPEDGATVWLPPGDLPVRVGTHRTADGALVSIRGRQLNLELAHVDVYERAGSTACAIIAAGLSPWLVVLDDRAPVYVYRDLVTHWTAGST